PDEVFLQGRFDHRENRAIDFNARIVFGDWSPGSLLLALIIPGQVRTDDLPTHPFIVGLEQYLRGEIENIRIMSREDDRLRPLKTVFLVHRSRANGIQRPRSNVLKLSSVAVIARDVAAIRTGIDDFRIVRIRRNVTALTATNR